MRPGTIAISLGLATAFFSSAPVRGQQQEPERDRQASAVPNPYMFLIRDPLVHRELWLSDAQKKAITEVTDELDGSLWALRDLAPEQGGEKLQQLIATAESRLETILDLSQQTRLNELLLRAQGPKALLRSDVAGRLDLTIDQWLEIQTIARETREALDGLLKQAQSGKPPETLHKKISRFRAQEAKRILAQLTKPQRSRWDAMLGRKFDVSGVGRVAVKAPELPDSKYWINAEPLTLAKLRGRVVALHFWTFG